ncbi:MAG: cupredoxin domain-containing protein, partial [Candidatus Limnocylindrales bacterium]
MRPFRLAPLAAVVVVAAACSAGGPTSAPSAPASHAATAAVATASQAEPTRIVVTLSDALRIEPASITVPSGKPVTFVVTNKGGTVHEFVVGDDTFQAAHDKEMMDSGSMGMVQDEPTAIGVDPGATKELTMSFEKPGTTL